MFIGKLRVSTGRRGSEERLAVPETAGSTNTCPPVTYLSMRPPTPLGSTIATRAGLMKTSPSASGA